MQRKLIVDCEKTKREYRHAERSTSRDTLYSEYEFDTIILRAQVTQKKSITTLRRRQRQKTRRKKRLNAMRQDLASHFMIHIYTFGAWRKRKWNVAVIHFYAYV